MTTEEGVRLRRPARAEESSEIKTEPNKEDPRAEKRQVVKMLTISQLITVIALILGGCCSNVIALENIVSDHPSSGKLVTFVQFVLVSLDGLRHFYNPKARFWISPPVIPLYLWVIPVLILFSTSVLNNIVWAYDISVPIHLIFRSSGSVTTMIIGWALLNRRYSVRKVASVVILTIGVVVSTWSKSDELVGTTPNSRFFTGVALLIFTTVLSSLQGVVQELTYEKHGNHWRETLFYTHFFSLALFVPYRHELITQFQRLAAGPVVTIGTVSISKPLVFLALNVSTQYLCVRGVNKLAAHTNALTVAIVLNIRKFISLLLSTVIFGHRMSLRDAVGAVLVFGAAVLYST